MVTARPTARLTLERGRVGALASVVAHAVARAASCTQGQCWGGT